MAEEKPCRIIAEDIVIDKAKCTKCGDCVYYCPADVIKLGADGYPTGIVLDKCLVCLACMAVCDVKAIKVISNWVCRD